MTKLFCLWGEHVFLPHSPIKKQFKPYIAHSVHYYSNKRWPSCILFPPCTKFCYNVCGWKQQKWKCHRSLILFVMCAHICLSKIGKRKHGPECSFSCTFSTPLFSQCIVIVSHYVRFVWKSFSYLLFTKFPTQLGLIRSHYGVGIADASNTVSCLQYQVELERERCPWEPPVRWVCLRAYCAWKHANQRH